MEGVFRPKLSQMSFRLDSYTENKYVKIVAGGVLTAVAIYSFYKFFSLLKRDEFIQNADDEDGEFGTAPDEYFQHVRGDGGITKRVLVLGLNRAGKTQLVRAFQQNSAPGEWLPALDSTKGCNIKSVKLGRYGLSIWDISGLPRFRSDWTKLLQYNQIDVIVWVVDSTDIHRFQESRQALHTFLEEPMANRLPVIIVAAKQDLSNRDAQDIAREMRIDRFCLRHSFNFVSTYVTQQNERSGVWRLYKLICTAQKIRI